MQGLIHSLHPLKTCLKRTLHAIGVAISWAHSFMTAHTGKGFLTDDIIKRWDLDHQNLVGLPLRVEVDHFTRENRMEFLFQTYHDLSIHIIYVQQTLTEIRSHGFDRIFLENVTSLLEVKLRRLLCTVRILIRNRGGTITSFVDAWALPDQYRKLQYAYPRYRKNYVLGKDLKVFLGNLKSNYTTMLNEF